MQPTAARRAPKKYRVRSAGDWIPTLRARSEYGLTGRELTELDVRSLGGGVGKGPPAYFYNPEQLWDAAVARHGGVDAFEKMWAARARVCVCSREARRHEACAHGRDRDFCRGTAEEEQRRSRT